ncbi:MAG TPA: tetratricopeptide repeat protein [Terracidiphilus sp.]|jgi:tetratricopeptide (TPR) repeat protein
MQRTLIAALLCSILSLAASAQTSQTAAQDTAQPSADSPQAEPATPFEEAQALAAKGRLDKAMTMLDQLAAQTPEPAGVERLRGIIFYQREDFPGAIDAFTKAARQDPADRESIEMHGVSLFRTGHSAEALPFLEQAHATVIRANIDPEYVLGLCYTDARRYDDARHAFATQYSFPPDSAEAYLLAARLFLRREFASEAAVEAHKALEINPTLPLAHQLLAEVALAKQDVPGAIRELESERKINPLDGLLYDRLGDAYLRNGQYNEAQQALNRAVLLEPNSTAPYILLGETFLKLNQPIEALHYLDHAAKMDPSSYLTHNLLGQAYKATGQVEAANREFQMVVDLQYHDKPQPAGK